MTGATGRRAAAAAFLGAALAMALGVYLPRLVLDLGDAASFAVYVTVTLGVVASALVVTHRLRSREVPAELGLDRSMLAGLGWAFALTVPMLVGFLVLRQGVFFEPGAMDVVTKRPWAVLEGWAGAGLVEETVFRGYLFRQLVLRAGWPAGRAILVCGLVFGALHVPAAWGRPPGEMAGAAVVTAVGGAGLCWFLREWSWNLWFVIGWHAFVNLWWTLGQAGTTVGGPAGNALRAGVVVLTIVVTVWRRDARDEATGPTDREA